MFDGIDTTWNRLRSLVHGSASIAVLDALPEAFAEALRSFDAFAPERSVPALARLHGLVSRLCPQDPMELCARPPSNGLPPPWPARGYLTGSPPGSVREGDVSRSRDVALERIAKALELASGVVVEATAPRELWGTDEPVTGTLTVYNRGALPIQFADYVDPSIARRRRLVSHPPMASVAPDSAVVRQFRGRSFGRPTAPWWLAEPRRGAMFANLSIAVEGLTDEVGSYPDAAMTVTVVAGGVSFGVTSPLVYRYADQVRGEVRRPVAGVPAVSVLLDQELEYAPARTPIEREISVHLQGAGSHERTVQLAIQVPSGLAADSASKTVVLPGNGVVRSIAFRLRGTLPPGRHVIDVTATAGGETYAQGYTTIDYEHINPRRMYRPSRLTIEAVDIAATGPMRVGYIQGVGDNSAAALSQLGVDVTLVDPASLAQADLIGYHAIVVGPRAYDANPALVANNARLLEYVRTGGTMVVQYGQYEMMRPGMTPYPLTINRPHDRVTNENAPVTLIDSTSTVLRSPNVITPADFEGWIQDRSLYMPRTFDPAYVPSVAMSDPGEPPNRGGILVAPYGRGTYVYTSLAFFRQLPNGVPGAARLFLNLLAARTQRPAQ
jgi:hypothetical protein